MKKLTLLLAAAIGGLLYIHLRRGGELTISSFRQSLRDLLGRARLSATRAKDEAERVAVHDVAENLAKATEQPIH